MFLNFLHFCSITIHLPLDRLSQSIFGNDSWIIFFSNLVFNSEFFFLRLFKYFIEKKMKWLAWRHTFQWFKHDLGDWMRTFLKRYFVFPFEQRKREKLQIRGRRSDWEWIKSNSVFQIDSLPWLRQNMTISEQIKFNQKRTVTILVKMGQHIVEFNRSQNLSLYNFFQWDCDVSFKLDSYSLQSYQQQT